MKQKDGCRNRTGSTKKIARDYATNLGEFNSCPSNTVVTPGTGTGPHWGQYSTDRHHVRKSRSKERLLRTKSIIGLRSLLSRREGGNCFSLCIRGDVKKVWYTCCSGYKYLCPPIFRFLCSCMGSMKNFSTLSPEQNNENKPDIN